MPREGMAATPWGTGEPCVCTSQAVSSQLAEEPLPSKKIAGFGSCTLILQTEKGTLISESIML